MNFFAKTALHRLLSLVIGTAVLILSGCASTPAENRSLYERLGGLPALTAVTDKMVDRAAADPRTRRSFKDVNPKALKASIVSQLCQATGGSCKYEGAPMDKAHRGLAITADEFDGLVGILVTTLDELKVPAREKNALLEILGPMKNDIVGK